MSMEPIVITITHSLGKDEVVRRLKPALAKAEQTFPSAQGGKGRMDR
jgi:hypothetical protein